MMLLFTCVVVDVDDIVLVGVVLVVAVADDVAVYMCCC